jgi:hypothetical protein
VTAATPQRSDFFHWADRLLQCSRASLEANTDAGEPKRVSVVVGSDLVWDECDCGGLLAVQLIRAFPSETFPIIKQNGPFNRCVIPRTVVQYHVSILRCVAQPSGFDAAPPAAKMTEDAERDYADRWAILRGVTCCLDQETRNDPGNAPVYILGEQIALGEGGKCAGSQLAVFLGLPNCVPCQDSATPWAVP